MRLYIAEKPSMGMEIAKCLPGPMKRGDGFIETGGGVVTWGFGHILRQAEPHEYEERYKKWRAEDLPIVPKAWKLLVEPSCAKQFGVIKGLIARADEIVHAGDPDREGQLLIDEVLDYVGNTKPVKRILLNALDEKSIREANEDLRDNRDFAPLKASALARARADWLIGMNLSRAYTLAARRAGHDVTLPVGRVKTPTLALVVRREREIEAFHPVAHYAIKGEFRHENGSFTAVWKPGEAQRGLDREGRLVDKGEAEAKLAAFAAGGEGKIAAYTKMRKEEPPRLPFSLSSLQVLAGKRFGYDPQQVLDTAQQLYEKKLTSYPRSDCEYLPKNQFSAAKTILANLVGGAEPQISAWAKDADGTLRSRAWDDKKITAHHAIVPTTVRVDWDKLSLLERDIYFLIAQAYIAQFYPAYVYDQTKVGVTYSGEKFSASGRVVRALGWKALYGGKDAEVAEKEEDKEEGAATLPAMKKGDLVAYSGGRMEEKQTKPPQRFTPATLLAAMKDIHKYVKDEDAKKRLRAVSGIGTEATRAAIIDDLIRRKFLKAQGKKKQLIPQPSAALLVDLLPDDMTYPDNTAVWEDALHAMAAGEGEMADFLSAQEAFARRLCTFALGAEVEPVGEYPCPRCHHGVLTKRRGKNGDFWGCTNFPRCRMTCDDKEGKPDLARAAQAPTRPHGAALTAHGAVPPPLSDEEMAAFTAAYRPELSARSFLARSASRRAFGDAPKPSAAALEEMPQDAPPSAHLCPKCRAGSLRLVHGRNGDFWGCSRYPQCTGTYDDRQGAPVLCTRDESTG
ncbi:MAG: DNA topoisomerase 3 [Schwartzia sp. (in: firmicutes)]